MALLVDTIHKDGTHERKEATTTTTTTTASYDTKNNNLASNVHISATYPPTSQVGSSDTITTSLVFLVSRNSRPGRGGYSLHLNNRLHTSEIINKEQCERITMTNGKVLDLAVAGSSKVRTKTIKKTLAPKWDETFSFERPAEHGCWLRVVVWDDDLMVWTKLRGV